MAATIVSSAWSASGSLPPGDQPAHEKAPPPPPPRCSPISPSGYMHLQRTEAASNRLGLPLPTLIIGLLCASPVHDRRAPNTAVPFLTMPARSLPCTNFLAPHATFTEPIPLAGSDYSGHLLRKLRHDARQRYRVLQKTANLSDLQLGSPPSSRPDRIPTTRPKIILRHQ